MASEESLPAGPIRDALVEVAKAEHWAQVPKGTTQTLIDAAKALDRLVKWHDRKGPEAAEGEPPLESHVVEQWWDEWGLEELQAFDQAKAALGESS